MNTGWVVSWTASRGGGWQLQGGRVKDWGGVNMTTSWSSRGWPLGKEGWDKLLARGVEVDWQPGWELEIDCLEGWERAVIAIGIEKIFKSWKFMTQNFFYYRYAFKKDDMKWRRGEKCHKQNMVMRQLNNITLRRLTHQKNMTLTQLCKDHNLALSDKNNVFCLLD